MEKVSQDIENMKNATAEARLAADIVRHVDKQNQRLWKALVACILALLLMGGAMIYGVLHMQEVVNEALLNALNTVAEMEVIQETTTQTVEGDSATINNVDGEQYNDSAVNGGSGE